MVKYSLIYLYKPEVHSRTSGHTTQPCAEKLYTSPRNLLLVHLSAMSPPSPPIGWQRRSRRLATVPPRRSKKYWPHASHARRKYLRALFVAPSPSLGLSQSHSPSPMTRASAAVVPAPRPVSTPPSLSIDAGPTGSPSDMITSHGPGPGPQTEAGRGTAIATPNQSRIGQTSRILMESNFWI
jgi:hypothetical protein